MEQGEERARGATRLDDWADVRWLLTRDKGDVRFFRATGRDVDFDEVGLAFDERTRHLSITGGDRRSEADRRYRDAVLAVVESSPGMTARDLRTAVSVTLSGATGTHVDKAVAALLAARQIHRIPATPENGKPCYHFPGAPGRPACMDLTSTRLG